MRQARTNTDADQAVSEHHTAEPALQNIDSIWTYNFGHLALQGTALLCCMMRRPRRGWFIVASRPSPTRRALNTACCAATSYLSTCANVPPRLVLAPRLPLDYGYRSLLTIEQILLSRVPRRVRVAASRCEDQLTGRRDLAATGASSA
jgi:hypothetical protein